MLGAGQGNRNRRPSKKFSDEGHCAKTPLWGASPVNYLPESGVRSANQSASLESSQPHRDLVIFLYVASEGQGHPYCQFARVPFIYFYFWFLFFELCPYTGLASLWPPASWPSYSRPSVPWTIHLWTFTVMKLRVLGAAREWKTSGNSLLVVCGLTF